MSYTNLSSITSLVSEMFASISGGDASTIQIGDVTLSQSTVLVDKVSLEMLPLEFRKQFFFSETSVVQPKSSYQAGSVIISVLPMRLNSDGCVSPCGLSLWGAIRQSDKEKHPLGESNSVPRLKADIYLEASMYSFGTASLAVPTVVRKPYIKGVNENLAAFNIALSDRSTDEEQVQVEYNSVRDEVQERIAKLAKEAGIATNQQFAVCIVGFPTYTKGFKGKDESMPAWYSATLPEGGYMLGVTKLGSVGKRELPEDLAGYAVNRANLMVGGRSFDDLLLEQIKGMSASQSVEPKAPKTEEVRPINNQTNNTVAQATKTSISANDAPEAWKKCCALKKAMILRMLLPGEAAEAMVHHVSVDKPEQLLPKYYKMLGLTGTSLLELLQKNSKKIEQYEKQIVLAKPKQEQHKELKEETVETETVVVEVESQQASVSTKVSNKPASKPGSTPKTSTSDLLSALDEEEEVVPVKKAKSMSFNTSSTPVENAAQKADESTNEPTEEVKTVKAKSLSLLNKLANKQ